MLRSLPRAGNSSLYLRPCLRTTNGPSKPSTPICTATTQQQQSRSASASHAISNPTLAGIEKRWEVMPPQEQADLWMALRDRMKIDWHDLTMAEKKAGELQVSYRENTGMAWLMSSLLAFGLRHSLNGSKKHSLMIWGGKAHADSAPPAAYWIAFGPHGPRSLPPPGEGKMIFKYVSIAIGISFVLFAMVRSMARPPPKTMTAEYQEMTNEYLRNQNVEPITGVSSEGYKGKGMVQSKPRKGGIPDE